MGSYRRGLCLSIVSIAALILLAIPVVAQLPTATILGEAKDSSGGVLPNVTVTITNVDTGAVRTVKTSDDGEFRAPELPVGRYEVRAEHPGFKTVTRKGITLEVTQQAVINLDFEVGAADQQVVVTEEAPMVNTQNATLGGTVNETKMAELPLNGRNYIDLALLQPGVDKDKNQGNQSGTTFSVNGAPPRSNNFTLDGAILQTMLGRSPVAGESGDALGLDGIKEYTIVAGTFQAEYGLAMGSQMVAVSKGGTNQWHGDAFEYLRNDAFDANTFFNNQQDVSKAPLRKNQFGAAFGGPIKKDKTFFYAVYEGIRESQGVPITNPVPSAGCHPANATAANNYGAGTVISAAQCPDISNDVTLSPYTAPFLAIVPLPNPGSVFDPVSGNPALQTFNDHNSLGENYGQMRFDQTFSDKDSFFARYTIDNAIQNQTVGDFSYFRSAPGARNQWITLAENHIFSPTVFNAVRISYSRTNATVNLANVGLPGGTGPQLVPGFSTGVVDLAGPGGGAYAEFGSVNAAPQTYNRQNIYTLSDDVNWIRGKHAFKFGVLLNRFNESSQATNSFNGQIIYNTLAQFLQGDPGDPGGQVEFAPTFATENRDFIFNTYGLYAQDDWRVKPRLTVNLGLRYEFMNTPHELNHRESRQINDFTDDFTLGPVIQNNTLRDFSPRVGLAYDLFGNGKTAIRGGAGIYYDMGNIGTALGQTANGSPPFAALVDVNPASATPAGIPSIQSWEATLTASDPVKYPAGAGFPLPIPDQVRSFYTPTSQGVFTPTFIDYRWKSPYMIQYNASVQQQLPWNMALGVAYVGNHGVHLPMVRDGNPIPPTSFGPCGDPASVCAGGKVPFWDTSSSAYTNLNSHFASDINVATAATSRYNALQVVLQKRAGHGLELEAAYTRSRVIDETQGQSNVQDCQTSGGLLGTYPLDTSVDRGPACFNILNNWEINVLYHLPEFVKSNGFLSKATNGWFISSIVSIQSGQPFSPTISANRSNSGVLQGGQGDRPDINTPALIKEYFNPANCTSLPGQPSAGTNPCPYTPIPYDPSKVITGDPNQWFNPAMFSIPPSCTGPGLTNCSSTVGQLGTALRNSLIGPPERNWDFSLVKDTKLGFLGEAGMLEFRAEFFNVINHPNFNGGAHFNTAIFSGSPDDPTSTNINPFSESPINPRVNSEVQDGQREIQFALRIEF
jgi:outer membrane receptor protein involved in Fe transport